ncbi:crossover junction endodeoxyribonuclease [Acinetobacter phage nACB1]|nr:crossover junction endodeoxyribonuclease [Acinetobacter phage nACB1]
MAIGHASLDDGNLVISDMRVVHTGILEDHTKRTSELDIISATQLYEGVQEVVHDADIVCVEVPTGSQSADAAKGRGICLGVLGSVKADHFIYVTPQAVKKVVGNPKATKREVVEWASKQHPEAPWPMYRGNIKIGEAEHMADAIVAIYAAASTPEFKQLILEYKHASTNQTPSQN